MLLELPTDLVISILGEWIKFPVLTAVDSATTNKSQRPRLLSILESKEFVHSATVVSTKSIDYGFWDKWKWIFKRKIRISKMSCANMDMLNPRFGPTIYKYFKSQSNSLRSLEWSEWNTYGRGSNEDLGKIIKICSKITQLDVECYGCVITCPPACYKYMTALTFKGTHLTCSDLLNSGKNCPNIESLTFIGCTLTDAVDFPVSSLHFSKLKMLTIVKDEDFSTSVGFTEATVEYLIRNAANLQIIHTDFPVPKLVAKHCKNVKEIKVIADIIILNDDDYEEEFHYCSDDNDD